MSLPLHLMFAGTSEASACFSLTVLLTEPVGPLPSLLLAQPARARTVVATDTTRVAERRGDKRTSWRLADGATLVIRCPGRQERNRTVTGPETSQIRRRLRQRQLGLAEH